MQMQQDQQVKQFENQFCLANNISLKRKKGIVFTGNSRVGKSTLACILALIKMKIVKKDQEMYRLQPQEQRYKHAVIDTMTSVTSIPNVYETILNGSQYSVIDLPGFMDSSLFKEICNLNYTKKILSQLQEALFVIVLKVHSKDNAIPKQDIQMLQRFHQMFPEQMNNTVMVVNFLQKPIKESLKSQIQSSIKEQIKQKFKENKKIQNYYESIVTKQKLCLVKLAQLSPKQQQCYYEDPKFNQFIAKSLKKSLQKISPITYQINLSKDTQKSKNVRNLIRNISKNNFSYIDNSIGVLKQYISSLLRIKKYIGSEISQQDYWKDLEILNKINTQSFSKNMNGKILYKVPKIDNLQNQSENQKIQLCQSLFVIINWITDYITRQQKPQDQHKDQLNEILNVINNKINQLMTHIIKICVRKYEIKQSETLLNKLIEIQQTLQLKIDQSKFINNNIENFILHEYEDDYQDDNQNNFNHQILKIRGDAIALAGETMQQKFRNTSKQLKQSFKVYLQEVVNQLTNQTLKSDMKFKFQLKKIVTSLNFKGNVDTILNHIFKSSYVNLSNIKVTNNQRQVKNKIVQAFKAYDQFQQNISVKQKDLLEKWKQNSKQQWDLYKCKISFVSTRFLDLSDYKDHTFIIQCYQNLKCCHRQLELYMQKLYKRWQQQQYKFIETTKLFQLYIFVGMYFQRTCRFQAAGKCFQMAKLLYRFQDQQKVKQAQECFLKLQQQNMDSILFENLQKYQQTQPSKMPKIQDEIFQKLKGQAKRIANLDNHQQSPHKIQKRKMNESGNYLDCQLKKGNSIIENQYARQYAKPQPKHMQGQTPSPQKTRKLYDRNIHGGVEIADTNIRSFYSPNQGSNKLINSRRQQPKQNNENSEDSTAAKRVFKFW